MKKNYAKPYLIVESFQLNAAIAAGCNEDNGLIPLGHDFNTCNANEEAPGLNYVGDKCIHDVDVEGDGFDEICYHGPLINYTDVFLDS